MSAIGEIQPSTGQGARGEFGASRPFEKSALSAGDGPNRSNEFHPIRRREKVTRWPRFPPLLPPR